VSISVRCPRRSLTMNVLPSSNPTHLGTRTSLRTLKCQAGDKMVFAIESSAQRWGASTRAIADHIDDNHRPRRHERVSEGESLPHA
jgi:hypothetical protein